MWGRDFLAQSWSPEKAPLCCLRLLAAGLGGDLPLPMFGEEAEVGMLSPEETGLRCCEVCR